MTDEEKKEVCKKSCGENPTTHSLFCPYTRERWLRGELEVRSIQIEYNKESK